jgi:hypothetical protein
MKKKAMIVLGGALSLTLAPFAASAYTAETALNACAEAITSELSEDGLAWKLDDESLTRERLKGREVIHLDVRDAETEAVVARADCVVDSRARVKRIKKLPIDAADARERSLTAY